jgi:hypothetical protein
MALLSIYLTLLRMVLVFQPMEPRWLRPGAPLVGPICNPYSVICIHIWARHQAGTVGA